jgi:preprotein translocase subunit YajC
LPNSLGILAQEAGGGAASPLQGFFNSPLPLFAGLAMIWYLTWFLPEKRKRLEEAKMLASLVKNDRIVTLGGLHGTVVSAVPDSDVIVLKIDEAGNTRVKVNRSAVVAITEHAKGKSAAKSGRSGKIPGDDTNSKNASDEDSSE